MSPPKEPAARMKELVEMSHNIDVDRAIPIARYFHSGRELIKAAAALQDEGDLEKAFVLYLRYVTLFLEKIIHHPEYAKADRNEKLLVKNECNRVLELAETLKASILEKYTRDYKESKDHPAGSRTNEGNISKKSVTPSGSARLSCDIDEIDKKFDFSQDAQVSTSQDPVFDPFNIEQLKQSLSSSGRD